MRTRTIRTLPPLCRRRRAIRKLARWFAEEQAFDRAIAAHLGKVPAPFGLKTRILAQLAPPAAPSRWLAAKLAGVAALLFLLTQIVNLFRPAVPDPQVSNYAREMVSFVRIAPPLEMESRDLGAIENWLAKKNAAPTDIPPRLAALQPAG